MLFFSGCKINLGLRILRKRDDGFHDIETIFYPVSWNDAIEYLPSKKTSIEILGRQLDGSLGDNTVLKAYRLLQEKHALPELNFKLLKNVPSGAGLGGGSANAAVVLKQLSNDFDLKLSDEALVTYASKIGSDCAFFVRNKPCLATGRGDVLTPVEVDLKNYWLLILFPDIHVNTAWAYKTHAAKNSAHQGSPALPEIVRQPVEKWKHQLVNDFEDVVFEAHPILNTVKQTLYESGAVFASMSGSGSAVFGLFNEKPNEENIGHRIGIKRGNRFCTRLFPNPTGETRV